MMKIVYMKDADLLCMEAAIVTDLIALEQCKELSMIAYNIPDQFEDLIIDKDQNFFFYGIVLREGVTAA